MQALSQLSYGPVSGNGSLPLVLLDVRVNDAADIVFILFFFKEAIVFLLVLAELLVGNVLDVFSRFLAFDHRHAGALGFSLGIGCLFFLFLVARDDGRRFRLGLGFLSLELLGLLSLLLFLDDGLRRHSLRLAWAPLLVERLGLEAVLALRALDGPLLKIVKSCAARRANALNSQISLDQSNLSRIQSGCEGRVVCHLSGVLSKAQMKAMNTAETQRPLAARRSGPLRGTARVPGDKSISHRALILGAMAVGETQISGLLEAEDVLNTAKVMRQFGAQISRDAGGLWRVWGTGVGGWGEPGDILDFGNSGTGSRLVMGAMATSPIAATFTGDSSLRKRPMKRVLEPLTKFGAEWAARDGGLMPVTLRGAAMPISIEYDVTVASAQVKSALLLAALNAPGRSRITQRAPTRDHTEKMLKAFGVEITVEPLSEGEAISVLGEAELRPCPVDVPGDPSSAAFPLIAALIVPGSAVTIPGVLLNARRIGLIDTLREMGADISVTNTRESGGEKIGDLVAKHSPLKGVEVPPERAPSMIDEYPILAIAAAFAEGKTEMRGLEELRVKESDRLSAIVHGLKANGVRVEEGADRMVVHGGEVAGGGRVLTHMDHRIAMSFLVMGLTAKNSVTIDDVSMIATSFPDFEQLMRDLGADFSRVNA